MNEVKTYSSYSFTPGDCYCFRKGADNILIKIIEEKDDALFCQYIKIHDRDCIVRNYIKVKEEDKQLFMHCSNEMFEEAYQDIVNLYGKIRSLCQPIKFLAEDRKRSVGDCLIFEDSSFWGICNIIGQESEDFFLASLYQVSTSLDRISVDYKRDYIYKKIAKFLKKIDPQIIQQINTLYEPVWAKIYYMIEDRYDLCKKYS